MNLKSILVTLVFFLSMMLATLSQAEDWIPWEEAVFVEVRNNYGDMAEQRMRRLHGIFEEYYSAPEMEKLKIVNDTMNKLPWIADKNKYHKSDYWATPLETITTFGGDCEDIAIAKLVALRAMGVPRDKLRLVSVRLNKTGEAHMVLAYNQSAELPVGEGNIYILDNFVPELLEQKQRQDFTALYSVDGDKDVHVIQEKDGERSVVKDIPNARFAKIDTIQKKIKESRAHYQELNAGRPLF